MLISQCFSSHHWFFLLCARNSIGHHVGLLVHWFIGQQVNKSLPGVVLHPQRPKKFGKDGSYGFQILPTSPSKTNEKHLTCLWNLRSKWSSFSQKKMIWVSLLGVVLPPRSPKIWRGWFLWVTNFAHTPSWHEKKFDGDRFYGCQMFSTCPFHDMGKRLTCLWNLKDKWSIGHVLAKKWPFWCHYRGWYYTPVPLGSPKFGRDGSYWSQFFSKSPL